MNVKLTLRRARAVMRGGAILVLVTGALAACEQAAVVPESESTVGPIATDDTPVAPAHVALDGEGIRVVAEPTGTSRLIAFGTLSVQAIAAVAGVLGEPVGRATNLDCGAGPMEFVSFPDGMMLNVQDDRFVGWTVRPGSVRAPTTMSGIGLGATRAQLDSVYVATVRRSTIGIEFSAGGISGVLESEAPTARITDLWAGLNCIAR